MLLLLGSLLAGIILLLIGATLWLSAWVPTNGKAQIEAQIEQAYPVDVTIASLRYGWWEGFVFEGFRVEERSSHAPWFASPRLTGQINPLDLLVQHRVRFRLAGDVTAPLTGPLMVSGVSDLRTKAISVEMETGDIELDRLSQVLAQRLPPELKRGTVHAYGRLDRLPGADPALTLRVTGKHLLWNRDAVTIQTDAAADGRITLSSQPEAPWSGRIALTFDHGAIDGLPKLGSVQELSGAVDVEPGRLLITTMRGTALDAPFNLEGTLTRRVDPGAPNGTGWDADLLLRFELDLARISPQLPAGLQAWQPAGQARVAVRCHGPLAQWSSMELMADGLLEDGALTLPHLAPRLERLNGRVLYDHAAKRLEIRSLTGRLAEAAITASGSATLTAPVVLDFVADLQGDASVVKTIAPAAAASLQTVSGPVTAHVTVRGSPPNVDWQADLTITDGALAWAGVPFPITKLAGRVHATNDTLTSDDLSCLLQERPVTVRGRLTQLRTTPRIAVEATWPDGSAALTGAWEPERLAVDSLDLTLGASRVRASGIIGRRPTTSSQLIVGGTVDLASLTLLPGVNRVWLDAWKPEGALAVQLRAQGSWPAWREMDVSGVIQSDEVRLRAVPLQQVVMEIQQQQRSFSVRLLRATLAGGRLAGQYVLKTGDHPQYMVDLDVTSADLAQLAAAIPAWHDRPMQGELSASAHLLNLGPTRATMTGRGWIRAAGQQLGNLPLLDRLMRGMFGVLSDRLGLSALRTATITEVGGQWTVAQERVATDDLRLSGVSGTEPISIYVRGSVGLDKTLDLTIEPELSDQLVLQSPSTASAAGALLKVVGGLERVRRTVGQHHVGGTLDNPQYKFQFSLDQLLNKSLPSGLGRLLDSLR